MRVSIDDLTALSSPVTEEERKLLMEKLKESENENVTWQRQVNDLKIRE